MTRIPKFLIASVIAACVISPSAKAEKLVLLHTNDTHSQIDPFKDDNLGGVARRKVVIDSVRAANPNVLLIDAGDIVQGTLFFNLYKGLVEEEVMNALGYDMRILGNHEFDNGMEALADNLKLASAELLCSNYQTKGTPLEGIFKPYTIKEIGGKRIAFMPINLQPKGMIADRNVVGLGFVDETETAENLAWYLKNIEEADYVVAITHIGHSPDKNLIGKTRNIDVLIGGHSHTLVNPADANTPAYKVTNADGKDVLIAQTGKGGRYIGEITIDLDNLETMPQSRVIPIDSRLDNRTDGTIEELILPYRAEVEALDANIVTKAPRYLAKEGEGLLNFISDFVNTRGKELAGQVDLTIMNKGGIRNSVEKGPVSEGEIITLMPFFNRIQVIEVSGENLLKAFDTMAKANGNGVSENVSAVYDPDTDHCLEVKISGKDINPNATYRVATIDYLANGGDYMQGLVDHKLITESPVYLFEDMLQYMRQGKIKKIDPSETKRMKPVKK